MFHWEPEGRYCCTKSMAIAPFWFSKEHLWFAIVPFWLSTDNFVYFNQKKKILVVNLQSLYHQLKARSVLSLFSDVLLRTRRALLLYKSMVIVPFWFWMEHCWIVLTPFWLSADDMEIYRKQARWKLYTNVYIQNLHDLNCILSPSYNCKGYLLKYLYIYG